MTRLRRYPGLTYRVLTAERHDGVPMPPDMLALAGELDRRWLAWESRRRYRAVDRVALAAPSL